MSGIYAIAGGIGEGEDATLAAQIATALNGIEIAPSIVLVNQQYMKLIATDSLNYANATAMSIIPTDSYPDPNDHEKDPLGGKGPHMAAVAAQCNLQKDKDQNQSDLVTGDLQNIVETVKSNAAYLGQSLDNVFKLESPMIELLAQLSTLIMEI